MSAHSTDFDSANSLTTVDTSLAEDSDPFELRKRRPLWSLGLLARAFQKAPQPALGTDLPDQSPSISRLVLQAGNEFVTDTYDEEERFIPIDESGERKLSRDGYILGGRKYRCRTFSFPNKGNTLWMLAGECTQSLGYRTIDWLFDAKRSICKRFVNEVEMQHLLRSKLLEKAPQNNVWIVTARSMFKEFGSRIIMNGRRVDDDYWEDNARDQVTIEQQLALTYANLYRPRNKPAMLPNHELTRPSPSRDVSSRQHDISVQGPGAQAAVDHLSSHEGTRLVQHDRFEHLKLNKRQAVSPSNSHRSFESSANLQSVDLSLLPMMTSKSSLDRLSTSHTEVDSGSGSSYSSDSEHESEDPVLTSMRVGIAQDLLQKYLSRAEPSFGSTLRQDNFKSCQGNAQNTDNGANGSGSGRGQTAPRETSQKACGKSLNKRPREEDDETGSNERRKPGAPFSDTSPKTQEETLLWACPFYKKNPQRHRSCGRSILKTIPRVKYHLKRSHQPPIHCDRCSLTFSNEDERVHHTRQAIPCSLGTRMNWEAITKAQKQELAKKSSAKETPRDNWYHIYRILFPGAAIPESPYLDGIESGDLRRILAFAETEGASIIEEIRAGSPGLPNLLSEGLPALHSVVQEFINLLFERWEAIEHRSVASSDASPHRSQSATTIPAVAPRSSDEQDSPNLAPQTLITPPPCELLNSEMHWTQASHNGELMIPSDINTAFSYSAPNDPDGQHMYLGNDDWFMPGDETSQYAYDGLLDPDEPLDL